MRVQANMADLTFLVWLKVKKTDRCASSAFHKVARGCRKAALEPQARKSYGSGVALWACLEVSVPRKMLADRDPACLMLISTA